MRSQLGQGFRDNLDELSSRKLLKVEQEIASPQSAHIHLRAWGARAPELVRQQLSESGQSSSHAASRACWSRAAWLLIVVRAVHL